MDMDRIDADYVAIPELDRYDDAELDQRQYATMDHAERRAAEKEMAERCVATPGRSRGPCQQGVTLYPVPSLDTRKQSPHFTSHHLRVILLHTSTIPPP